MNKPALQSIRKTLTEFVRKGAESDTEAWLKAGLPKGHGLPAPAVMAAQMVSLQETVLALLRAQLAPHNGNGNGHVPKPHANGQSLEARRSEIPMEGDFKDF